MEPRNGMSRRRSVGPPQDPQAGATIGGRYTIVRLLARGGVGLVYLARRNYSHDAVVVKVLAANLVGDPETTARFDREAQRLRGIQHPNIVAMVDYGHADGSAYLVMEHLEGELLGAYAARKGPLALADFAPIAAQILKAIGYAHAQGLMHRDLKPGNIMLCARRGRGNFVKILDFGMARLIEGERDITSEQIVGTANYLSPEQIRGEAIDARVDVYAIGVMFYALLAGRLPFHAEHNAALLYKHVHEAPPPLTSVMPAGHDIPAELLALVHRCLAKEVADRPAHGHAVAAELAACVPGELFHLPIAEGGAATPSSSYAVLPAGLEPGPDDLSGRLTRPVQALRTGMIKTGKTGALGPTDPHDTTTPITGATASTGRVRTRNRLPQVRPTTAAMTPMLAPPSPDGGRLWLVLAGAVVLALLGLGGYLLSRPARSIEDVSAALDERRVLARLEQVELDLRGGDLDRARTGLAIVESSLRAATPPPAQPGVAARPDPAAPLRMRTAVLQRRVAVADTVRRAHALEAQGQTAAALSSYRDALTLDPNHIESRAALARLAAPAPITSPAISPTTAPSRTGRVRGGEAKASDTRQTGRPSEAPTEVVRPGKPADDGLLGDARSDDAVFLPVD